jgi:hypothetical protein
MIMSKINDKKREFDRRRTEWRKKHRSLDGKIILFPNKPPEHINARGSKTYNWFWKRILLVANPQEIPAIISNIKDQISYEKDKRKIQTFRTMIGMAEDAYRFKQLEDIKEFDTELQLGESPAYDSDLGIIYKNGEIYTTDYNEDESKLIIRDVEGVILDLQYSDYDGKQKIK